MHFNLWKLIDRHANAIFTSSTGFIIEMSKSNFIKMNEQRLHKALLIQ